MKPLIYIFLISLSYVLSDIIHEKKFQIKRFPKKVKHGLVKINNSGKYIKQKTLATRKYIDENEYTLFPKIHDGRVNIPASPYFEEGTNFEIKTRFKKTLAPRSKRSVTLKKDDKKKPPQHPAKQVTKPAGQKDKGQTKKGKAPNKGGKKINRNIKRKKQIKRQGNRLRGGKLRNGPNRNRNLKHSKSQNRNKTNKKRRIRLVDEQGIKNQKYKKIPFDTKDIKVGRRLIAARDAMIEDYPYVVSIQKGKEHWCAGAILNPRLVITTANCLWKGRRMSRMSVRAGSRHTDRGGQVAYIKEIMKHPGWKIRKTPDNDIALVLLDRNIKFSHGVHGVDLPNRVMMPAFEDAWVTSWGSERRDGLFESKSDTLQVYHARVMDRQKCNNVTSRFGVRVTENFICLAQTGRRAPCTRDTGAPAVSDGVLWGMASWGIRKLCGTERFPAMFSYLASQTNLDFIINATHYLMSDETHYPYLDRIQRQP